MNTHARSCLLASFALFAASTLAQPPTAPQAPAQPVTPPSAPLPTHEAAFVSGETQLFTGGFQFAEGPCLTADGKLLICDLASGMIYLADPANFSNGAPIDHEVYRAKADNPAGAALDPQGRLVVAHFAGKVTRTEADGTIAILADSCQGVKLGKCNDLAILPDGTIYFSDFGSDADKANPDAPVSKGLFVLTLGTDANAPMNIESVDTDYVAANGVAYDAKAKVLYVADYGIARIYAYDLADGKANAKKRRTFADFADAKSAGRGNVDGLKVDENGRVFTTGPGGVWVLSKTGERLALLKIRSASNLCLGPIDEKTKTRPVYITAQRNVHVATAKAE